MAKVAAEALRSVGYDNIGTVEMLRAQDGTFHFLEVNTRLQVEHAVTEMITGLDLVTLMIQVAAGAALADVLPSSIPCQGHAIEARIYAEDPVKFFPSPGTLHRFCPPAATCSVRIETGYAEGTTVSTFYDPLLAKVIVHGETRDGAIEELIAALEAFEVDGVKTNKAFLLSVLRSHSFRIGDIHTGLAGKMV